MQYIESFLLAFSGGLATLAIGALVRHFIENPKKREEKRKASYEAILCLLRSDLLEKCRILLEAGEASIEEKEAVAEEWESYKKLGGDGFVNEIAKDIVNLPAKRKEA